MFHEIVGNDLEQSIIFFRNRIKYEMSLTGKRIISFPSGEKGNKALAKDAHIICLSFYYVKYYRLYKPLTFEI